MPKSNPKRTPKPRLDVRDWLRAAIDALAEDGIAAVSVGRLAAKLNITRGSFYHHFRDRRDLLQQMLAFWQEGWTRSVRDENRALGLDPRTALLALMRTVRHHKAAEYDVAFRAWALHDPMAHVVVRRVDEERLAYIRQLFAKMGFDALDAENRARLLLYYEMTEPAVFARQSKALEEQLLLERHRFLTTDTRATDTMDRPVDTGRAAKSRGRQTTRGVFN